MDTINQQLQRESISDKVLHKIKTRKPVCNTLSGDTYAFRIQGKSSSRFFFRKTAMLDDRTAFSRIALFCPVGETFSQPGGLLQQLHPQREMVHPAIDSQIQPGRPMVLRQHRFFKRWQSNQNTHQTGYPQSSGNDSRDSWRKTPIQKMPYGSGATESSRQTTARKVGAFLCLLCCRLAYSSSPIRELDPKKLTLNSYSSRDCGFSFSGIYPQPGFRLPTVSPSDCGQEKHYRPAGTDRKAIQRAWFKKNDVNCLSHALQALSSSLERLSQEISPSVLFPKPPFIPFRPEINKCSCGQRLLVRKTHRKTVLSMTGPFVALQTALYCPVCSNVFSSEALRQIVKQDCNVAYDVIVFIGRALFQRHRTAGEVQDELMAKNDRISIAEINYLGRKFISYLALGHRQAMPRIRQKMKIAGGYVLHLDATHEGNSPALMTGLDGLSKMVLANVKIPSENADYIIPFLEELKTNYGTPKACVHDMGTGICKAVAKVFPNTPDFVCHFHFLRDIGKDFLEPAYREIRNRLRKYATSTQLSAIVRKTQQQLGEKSNDPELLAKEMLSAELPENKSLLPSALTYVLASWCLRGKHIGDGYGFPFDRPQLQFAERLLETANHLPELLELFMDEDKSNIKHLVKLTQKVADIAKDPSLKQAIEELRWRSQIFDRLRQAMRIALQGGTNGLNDDGTPEVITSIRQSVEQFRRQINVDLKLANDRLSIKMVKQIDKYGDKLFADPITVHTPNGIVIIYPQRTNNILEQFFRDLKRGQRRKTGNNSMSRILNSMLADTPLVKNLGNPEYMKMLLNGKGNLEELFAEIDRTQSHKNSKIDANHDRILPGFRAVIDLPALPEYMANLFNRNQGTMKSNRVLDS